jgi:hypothetical protein
MFKSTIAVFTAIAWISISTTLHAESFFLKDGSITEGHIVLETDAATKIKLGDNKIITIDRKKILRVVYDTAYKKKVYLKLSNGKLAEGYIVEEDRSEYTIRDRLDSPAEYKLDKKDVVAVSKEKLISKGGYYSLGIIPGAAQFYAGKDVEGGIFLGTFLASMGFFGYAYWDYDTKHKAYLAVPRGGDFNTPFTAYQNSSYVFIASISLAGAVYLLNWIDVLFIAIPDFGQGKKGAQNAVFFNIAMASGGASSQFISSSGEDRYNSMLRSSDTSHFDYYTDLGLYVSLGIRF